MLNLSKWVRNLAVVQTEAPTILSLVITEEPRLTRKEERGPWEWIRVPLSKERVIRRMEKAEPHFVNYGGWNIGKFDFDLDNGVWGLEPTSNVAIVGEPLGIIFSGVDRAECIEIGEALYHEPLLRFTRPGSSGYTNRLPFPDIKIIIEHPAYRCPGCNCRS